MALSANVLFAQVAANDPALAERGAVFEVATIKLSRPDAAGKTFIFRGHQYSTIHTSVNDLISYAWGLHARQIAGGPAWLDTEKFDIIAKPVVTEPNAQQLKEMVRNLLEERFQLTFHTEKNELSVYAIVVGKAGPKLTKTSDPGDLSSLYFPAFGTMNARIASMSDLARTMQQAVLDRPVVDQTGLRGRYDFTLTWTPDEFQFGAMGAHIPAPSDQARAPDLFTAMQQQLGLKVESTKAVVDVLVIDRIERASENWR